MGLFSYKNQEKEIVDVYKSERFKSFKRVLHIYIINNNDSCFIRLNSFDAKENKSLYDAPIIKEIPVDKTYYHVFCSTYKEYTGEAYKTKRVPDREVLDPKVIVDTKKKIVTYIVFAHNVDDVQMHNLTQEKFVYDWIGLKEFLEIVFSNKFVNYGDSYREFVVHAISELFNMGDYIKTLKYSTQNVN